LPEESEVLPNNPYNFMGYKTTSFLFIKCKPCLEKHPELRAKSTPDKRRRDGEDGFSSDEDGKANDKYKRRKIVKISEEDMATVPVPRPTLVKTEGTRTKPDIQLVEEIKQIINTRDLLQKDIADDLHVSQSIISQYLNNQARKNGWDALEAKLRLWTERVHKRGDEKRAPTTNTAAVTPARNESNTSEYSRAQEDKEERWRTDNARHAMQHTSNNAAAQNSSEQQQRSYWDAYTPVKNDGKKSASFSNYSGAPQMYGYEGHMMMNGHAPSPLEQSYVMHQQFFKPAALTGHLNGSPNATNNNSGSGNSSPAPTPANTNGTAANNNSSIFNSPNVQLPPLVTHGNPYAEYGGYPSHMFRQPFPPQMNYPMQPVTGYAYLAQGFAPMPAYPIPSPQSNFLAASLPPGANPAHFQRHEEYFNNANANNNSANQQPSK
jgi:predicted XRE-type DNA-binding protein